MSGFRASGCPALTGSGTRVPQLLFCTISTVPKRVSVLRKMHYSRRTEETYVG